MRGLRRLVATGSVMLMILTAACGAEEDAAPPATTAVQDGGELEATWMLRTGPGALETLTTAPPTLTVEQGTASGFAGCNTFTATAEVNGNQLRIDDVVTTRQSCPEAETLVEETYLQSLSDVAAWAVTGDELQLSGETGAVILRFGPETIEGTWRATAVRTPDGDSVASVPDGVALTISFFRNGTLTGSAGCNDYSGTFIAYEEALQLGELATTEMACDPDTMATEAAYLDALRQATQLRLSGDTLDLLDDSRSTLIIYERGAP